jgi:phosphoglycolate phosphatase
VVAAGWAWTGNRPLLPKPYPVYLFDIDGTLLDSAADICGAVQQSFLGHVAEPPSFEYLKKFVGYHLDVCYQEVLPHYNRAQLDEMVATYRAVYPARKHAATSRYPGVLETLQQLPGRKGTATTKGTPTTRAILEQFELLPYFDHVQGTDGFPCKPEPDVILRALAALGARPEDCLFAGDSAADMEAGRRAGVTTCAVRWGYGNVEEMSRWNPDYWISDPAELLLR